MNYIGTLTQEEKKVLCRLMTGKELKELFISNERAFSQMQGGFRAKKLKEEQALHIAINNVNKPLIADGINHWVDFQVKKIQKNIKALEEEGTPSQIALPLVLQDSVFTNNIELFLKFAGEAYPDYTCERLSGQVEIIKLVQEDHPVDDIQDRLQDAEKRIISLHQDNDDLRAKYEPKLQEITLENNKLAGLLAEAQKQITALQNTNATLQENTKALIYADWEKEYTSLLQKVQEKLAALETQIQTATAVLSQTQEAYAKAKQQEAYVTACIAEKEKLAVGVENAVNDRIQKARENAADFIANMAFVGTQPTQAVTLSNPESTAYCMHPALENFTDLEAHHTWADVINTVAMEFEEAGVMKTYDHGLAAFLCAAYIEKQPILLVGPNAIDIAQAFGAAVTAQKYGLLSCEGNYSDQVITNIGTNTETIVIINNLFASGWMNRLPELLSHKDIFYIVTHPYAEDIQVEPKSLYGFMLPLFTEFFVDTVASGKYYGGYFAEDFQNYAVPKNAHQDSRDTRKDLKVLAKLKIGSLIKNRINRLVATMHDIHPTLTEDEKFLFAVLPIAYASLSINELAEAIDDPQKGIAISDDLKRDLRYVLGEN